MVVNIPMDNQSVSTRLRSPASTVDLAEWLLGKGPLTEPVRTDVPKTDPLAITTSFSSLNGSDFLPMLDSIVTPCLMVHGQSDPAIQHAGL